MTLRTLLRRFEEWTDRAALAGSEHPLEMDLIRKTQKAYRRAVYRELSHLLSSRIPGIETLRNDLAKIDAQWPSDEELEAYMENE